MIAQTSSNRYSETLIVCIVDEQFVWAIFRKLNILYIVHIIGAFGFKVRKCGPWTHFERDDSFARNVMPPFLKPLKINYL